MSVTPRTAYLVAVASALALVTPLNFAIFVVLAVVAVAAVDALMVRKTPVIERMAPAQLVRGIVSPLTIRVVAGGRVAVRQPVGADVEITPELADGALDAQVLALRRGRHRLSPVAVRVDGPLGLGRWHHNIGDGLDVKAYPDVVAGHRIARAVREGRFATAGRVTRGPLGLGTDFETLRPYQPDDDVRQINWPATVRAGTAISNRYRIEQDRDVICLVDTGRLMTAPLGPLTLLDAAFDAMVAVVLTADELGDRCGLVAFDAEVRRLVAPSRRAAALVIEQSFDLEPNIVESNYEAAFWSTPRAKRSLVFVFTDVLDSAAAEPLIDALPILLRRHRVIVVAAADTVIEGVSLAASARSNPRHSAHDVDLERMRAVVAQDALAARREAVGRIRALGCMFVEGPPHRLAIAAVEGYLRNRV
jgi:uncharacterized protein (DUF58 family)